MAVPVVLFDLDGTLTDSAPGIVASYRYALAALGMEAPDAAIRRCIGPPLQHSLHRLGVPDDLLPEAVAAYRENFARSGLYDNRLYEGTEEMLRALVSVGTVLGVATSKLDEYARTILEHFGVMGYFATVSGSTGDGRRLYKEDIAAHALQSLGNPTASSVALVGDREHDMFAAHRLGLIGVGVSWGYGSEAELFGSGAEVVVDGPSELTALLLGEELVPDRPST